MKELWGSIGSVLTGACCLGFAPLVGLLGAVGAGFLIRDAVLIPLFVLSLAFTLWALWRARARHGDRRPFLLGLVSAVVAFASLWLLAPLAWLGLAGVVAASVWDILLLRGTGPGGGHPASADASGGA